MTRDDIIRMAREAGWEMDDSCVLEPQVVWYISQGQLERFAALVAAAEREAFKAELDKEDSELLDDEAFNIVFGLQQWMIARGQEQLKEKNT